MFTGVSTTRNMVKVFGAASTIDFPVWQRFVIPTWASFVYMELIGAGGGAGDGKWISIAGTAPAGGGGGSGGLTVVCMPTVALPSELFVSVPVGSPRNTDINIAVLARDTVVSTEPLDDADWHVVARAHPGFSGGSGWVDPTELANIAGPGGTGGPLVTSSEMLLGWAFVVCALAGQNAPAGGTGTSGAGGSVSFPATGIWVTAGGSGASGISATRSGGAIIATSGTGALSLHPASTVAASARNGDSGTYRTVIPSDFGIGAGGGANSISGNAYDGGYGGAAGCGAGGGGGVRVVPGASGGIGGYGGDGRVVIACW